ncbi:MAG UNVERIFIED_CONTAM: hypothetical protein MIJ72_09570, partial [Staphylococcus saprophyticus]
DEFASFSTAFNYDITKPSEIRVEADGKIFGKITYIAAVDIFSHFFLTSSIQTLPDINEFPQYDDRRRS